MKESTNITITRDKSEDIELEVTGRYCEPDFGGRSASGLPVVNEPERFEDIEAVVVEDVHHEDDERLVTYKAGEVIRLTRAEEELAEQALLKAWNRG